jgi:hypothetical protein
MLMYKILVKGKGPYSGHRWSEEWMPDVGSPIHCRTGYYGIRAKDVEYWVTDILTFQFLSDDVKLSTLELWIVELGGTIVDYGDKVAGSTARLVRNVGMLDQFTGGSHPIEKIEPCSCNSPYCTYQQVQYTCGNTTVINRRVKPSERCQQRHFNFPELDNVGV